MNEIRIFIISDVRAYEELSFNGMTFPTAEHAMNYLKQIERLSDKDIKALNIRFYYTNESRECDCSLCEKRDNCHIAYKFQRLPRNPDGTGGLGMCPKL